MSHSTYSSIWPQVRRGTVHALMGENGAGKSTLMNILGGAYAPDKGEVVFNGERITLFSVSHALARGIAMIHQELAAVSPMTVAENLFLGREPRWRHTPLVDRREMTARAAALFHRLEIPLDPRARAGMLSIAQTQLLEIAKAISYEADLLIMDEPTSAITENEVAHLFRIIRTLKDNGVSVIYITHKIDEVFAICDEATVLRDGVVVGTDLVSRMGKDQLISMMVGREMRALFPKEDTDIGDVVLSVRNLTRRGEFTNVSFDLHRGEILGVAGLMGPAAQRSWRRSSGSAGRTRGKSLSTVDAHASALPTMPSRTTSRCSPRIGSSRIPPAPGNVFQTGKCCIGCENDTWSEAWAGAPGGRGGRVGLLAA